MFKRKTIYASTSRVLKYSQVMGSRLAQHREASGNATPHINVLSFILRHVGRLQGFVGSLVRLLRGLRLQKITELSKKKQASINYN